MRARGWTTLTITALVAAGLLGVSTLAAGAASSGRWIVFSAHPNGTETSQLFRVDASGAGLQQITTGALPAISPSFSRNGTRLLFSRLGSGIFSVGVDGKGLKRLTTNGRDSYPVWSPDGKRIAFLRLYRNAWRLYTMSPTGTAERRLPQAPPAGRPTWAANSKGIYIPAAGDLVRVDPVTGRVLKYYGVELDIQTGQTASVSPSGRGVTWVGPRVSSGPPDCGESRCPQFALYLANVSAPHRPHRIVNDTGAAGWSPDGTKLVYVALGVLTVRNVATGAVTTVSTGAHLAAGDAPPAWQPR